MADKPLARCKACSKCGIEKPHDSDHFNWLNKRKGSLHAHCIECRVADRKARYWRDPDRERQRRREKRAEDPEKYNAIVREHRSRNREKYAAKKRKWWRDLRDEAITAYGGRCTCCGESERDFLTIEHIGQTGKDHRKRVGVGGVYSDLKRQNWPTSGITLLCFNCNFATARGEVCPHKRA